MEVIAQLITGFSVALQPVNLVYCFAGVLLGTLIGVLPGIGPLGAMSILLPVTFGVGPVTGVIMLAGIYYGAMYGGSISSILVNIPGEAASVVTCIDGYQMARNGRAGPALGMSALGSFIGGTVGVVMLMALVTPLASAALMFGPPEYFALMALGMLLVVYLGRGSFAKGIVMVIVGLVLGTVGTDITGRLRFNFGSLALIDGIALIPLVMGLFGVSEVLMNVERSLPRREILASRLRDLLPDREDWRRSAAPVARGSLIGFFLGMLPGGGSIIASFASYSIEKKISKRPEEFGKGAIEGVAGPETANNAATAGCFVPLLALGIPSNVIMALLLGALLIHGVVPGPMLAAKHPDIFWGTIASMYIGNIMLLVLNLPLIGMWVKLLKVPYGILAPLILLFTIVGAYSVNNSVFEVYLLLGFGLLGYVLRKMQYDVAPLALAFILGPMLEAAFRQSLMMSSGDLTIFFIRPISGIALLLGAIVLASSGIGLLRKKKRAGPAMALVED